MDQWKLNRRGAGQRLRQGLAPDCLDRLGRGRELAVTPLLPLKHRGRLAELGAQVGKLGLGLAPRVAQDLASLVLDILQPLLDRGADLGRGSPLGLGCRQHLVGALALGLQVGDQVLHRKLASVDHAACLGKCLVVEPEAPSDRQCVALAG